MDKMDNQSSDDENVDKVGEQGSGDKKSTCECEPAKGRTCNRTSKPNWEWVAALLVVVLLFLVAILCIGWLGSYSNIKFYSSSSATNGDKEKPEESGIEFYPPKPYLMVEKKVIKESKGSDNPGIEVKTKIIYLPDLTKPKYAKIETGLFGPDEWAVNFSGGMLMSVGTQSSSKIMMPDIPAFPYDNQDFNMTPSSKQITQSCFEFYEIIQTEDTTKLQRVKSDILSSCK